MNQTYTIMTANKDTVRSNDYYLTLINGIPIRTNVFSVDSGGRGFYFNFNNGYIVP